MSRRERDQHPRSCPHFRPLGFSYFLQPSNHPTIKQSNNHHSAPDGVETGLAGRLSHLPAAGHAARTCCASPAVNSLALEPCQRSFCLPYRASRPLTRATKTPAVIQVESVECATPNTPPQPPWIESLVACNQRAFPKHLSAGMECTPSQRPRKPTGIPHPTSTPPLLHLTDRLQQGGGRDQTSAHRVTKHTMSTAKAVKKARFSPPKVTKEKVDASMYIERASLENPRLNKCVCRLFGNKKHDTTPCPEKRVVIAPRRQQRQAAATGDQAAQTQLQTPLGSDTASKRNVPPLPKPVRQPERVGVVATSRLSNIPFPSSPPLTIQHTPFPFPQPHQLLPHTPKLKITPAHPPPKRQTNSRATSTLQTNHPSRDN